MSAQKVFAVDKFLGLNEAADTTSELKMGEASKIGNFTVTDDFNLKNRPGVRIVDRRGVRYLALWQGYIGTYLKRLVVYHDESINATLAEIDGEGGGVSQLLYCDPSMPIKVFSLGDRLYIYATGDGVNRARMESVFAVDCDGNGQVSYLHGGESFYQPVILTDCAPVGGGTEQEPLNILTDYVRVQFCGDGASTVYKFPPMVSMLATVSVDNVTQKITQYEYDEEGCVQFVFASPPPNGVNNVEFLCLIADEAHQLAGEKFLQMRHSEAYNGSTDKRLFFYGDGSNICYYTGNPTFGKGLYIPAGNEIAVDSSASVVTALRTQNTRLLAFKPDGAFSIDYEPVTLEDGRVIAGFYIYPVHRGIGNEMDGQVQTVNNYARTLCGGSLYEWRNSASYHKDERYAKRISEKVSRTLAAADPTKVVTCDDNATQTYYMFLNDDNGTVLVNRYAIDVWTSYTGAVFKGVQFACASQNDVLFATTDTVYRFDTATTFDAPLEEGGESQPIQCVWESGYMAFGTDYKRKYSSNLWVSMLPEANSRMEITVQTDRRDEYLEKVTGLPLLDFSCVDFSNFSFLRRLAPQIKRIKIKVKKFVYYKLIFRVTQPGARATVLGYDQQVRYSSNVK